MALLLVTYSLNEPGRDYSGFHDAIEAYPHVRLSELLTLFTLTRHLPLFLTS
jgi:hypothetical protein